MLFSNFDRFYFSKEAKKLATLLNVGRGFYMAEIGAGKALYSFYMANIVEPEGLVFTTEYDAKKLNQIRENIKKRQITNMQAALAGENNPNLSNIQFDIIFMSKVYHHFTNAVEQNRSFYDHLKPGRHLAIIDFEPKWYLRASMPKGIPESYGGHGIWKKVLINEVENCGFKLTQLLENFSTGGLYCAIFQKS